ncbi:MAG: acetylglutamate kinase [Paraglaciecola sp.]|jgi:acetylglutamate kinase
MSRKITTLVIKVGGAFMQADQQALALLKVIAQLQQHIKVVLIHGGGPMVEELMQALQLSSSKINGLRVTPKQHMPYITGALAGTANKQLCALAIKSGLIPVGLCLADGQISTCTVMCEELGAVGVAKAGKSALLDNLLASGMLPIISSIGADTLGNLLNVNADQAATVIAQVLNADLLLLSDVTGVLDANHSLLSELRAKDIKSLIVGQVIRDGMQVKVQAALEAAISLKRPVTIASWRESEQLLGLLHQQTIGTTIIPDTYVKESL